MPKRKSGPKRTRAAGVKNRGKKGEVNPTSPSHRIEEILGSDTLALEYLLRSLEDYAGRLKRCMGAEYPPPRDILDNPPLPENPGGGYRNRFISEGQDFFYGGDFRSAIHIDRIPFEVIVNAVCLLHRTLSSRHKAIAYKEVVFEGIVDFVSFREYIESAPGNPVERRQLLATWRNDLRNDFRRIIARPTGMDMQGSLPDHGGKDRGETPGVWPGNAEIEFLPTEGQDGPTWRVKGGLKPLDPNRSILIRFSSILWDNRGKDIPHEKIRSELWPEQSDMEAIRGRIRKHKSALPKAVKVYIRNAGGCLKLCPRPVGKKGER